MIILIYLKRQCQDSIYSTCECLHNAEKERVHVYLEGKSPTLILTTAGIFEDRVFDFS